MINFAGKYEEVIIMAQVTGGFNRYVRIDLKRYGNNELLEDLPDSLEVEARKDEPTVPLREFMEEQNRKRGIVLS